MSATVLASERRSHAAPRAPRRGSPDLRGGLVVTAVVVLGHLLVLARNRRFSYQDDAQAYFLPMWRDLGQSLRAGEFPVLAPEHWMAGHYPFESQVGLWNPVQLVINLMAPSVTRLAVLAAAVAMAFAVLLGLGVYRVALAHGAAHRWAVLAGCAAPFAGWTLWYDTASWTIALMCTAYVTHAWASLVRYVHGLAGPLPAFAWLFLVLSTGYPYGAVAAGLMTAAVLVGGLAARVPLGDVARGAVVAVAAVACSSIAFLPGFAAYEISFRDGAEHAFLNDGGLVVPWSEVLAAGVPTYVPQIAGFAGAELVPSTFIAWFLLPALPFLRWSALRVLWRRLVGPLTLATLMLVSASAPSTTGPLRWPGRYVVYLGIALLVVAAVVATAGLATDHWRRRAGLSAALVTVVSLRAASITAPDLGTEHLSTAVLVLALGAGALLAHRWRGERAVAAVLVLGVPVVLWSQLGTFPRNLSWEERNLPSDIQAASEVFPDRPGSTLQLAELHLIPEDRRALEGSWSTLSVANYARSIDRAYANAYTPVGFVPFSEMLCMDFLGNTCPEAKEALFRPLRDTGARPADLMALDRVVLQRTQHPRVHLEVPPEGWRRTAVDEFAVVWERIGGPGPGPGGVTWTRGVEVDDVHEQSDVGWRGEVSSQDGGRLAFSRLAWPSYSATVDGESVETTTLRGGFLAVEVPTGGGELELSYETPGWRAGAALAFAGLAVLLLLVVVAHRRNAATRRRTAQRSDELPVG